MKKIIVIALALFLGGCGMLSSKPEPVPLTAAQIERAEQEAKLERQDRLDRIDRLERAEVAERAERGVRAMSASKPIVVPIVVQPQTIVVPQQEDAPAPVIGTPAAPYGRNVSYSPYVVYGGDSNTPTVFGTTPSAYLGSAQIQYYRRR